MIAVTAVERLATLREIVRLGTRAEYCAAVGMEVELAEATALLGEVVEVMGFDPIAYQPGRDNFAKIVTERSHAMLKAMPGTTAEIAAASGCRSRDVPAYMLAFVRNGEVRRSKAQNTTYWELTT